MSAIGWIVSFAALVTAIAALWQSLLLRRSMGIDALLRLNESWNSKEMLQHRKAASTKLLARIETSDQLPELEEVLNFLRGVAVLLQRHIIDCYAAWHFFYWTMSDLRGLDYILDARIREGRSTWRDLSYAISMLKKVEAKQNEREIGAVGPSDRQVSDILESESKLAVQD